MSSVQIEDAGLTDEVRLIVSNTDFRAMSNVGRSYVATFAHFFVNIRHTDHLGFNR